MIKTNIIVATRNLLDGLTADQTQLKGALVNWKIGLKKLPRREQNDKAIDTQKTPRPKEENK